MLLETQARLSAQARIDAYDVQTNIRILPMKYLRVWKSGVPASGAWYSGKEKAKERHVNVVLTNQCILWWQAAKIGTWIQLHVFLVSLQPFNGGLKVEAANEGIIFISCVAGKFSEILFSKYVPVGLLITVHCTLTMNHGNGRK